MLRMNRENVRNPARSVTNPEFHHTGDEVNAVARNGGMGLEAWGVGGMGSDDDNSCDSKSFTALQAPEMGLEPLFRGRFRPHKELLFRAAPFDRAHL